MDKSTIGKVDLHIQRKFKIQEKLGEGAYGIVWKAVRRSNNKTVAVKKIFDAFRNSQDSQRTFREIHLLIHLSHPNIVKMKDFYKAQNDNDFYLIFEHVESDLHKVIKANLLEDIHQRFIIYQLVNTLDYLHDLNILHRDIKPSNLLINTARTVEERKSTVLTDYVATRWYRAPELLLGSTQYSKKVDLFAVGCILGELILGEPLFCGTSTLDQLKKIVSITGRVSQKQLDSIGSKFASKLLDQINHSDNVSSISKMFPRASADAKDLIKKLLRFDPRERISTKQALNHPYLNVFNANQRKSHQNLMKSGNGYRQKILKLRKKISNCLCDSNKELTTDEYREKLYTLIRRKKVRDRKKRRHLKSRRSRTNLPSRKSKRFQ